MHQLQGQDLASFMPDLKDHAEQCRFYNCTHLHEPGCEVRAAVDRGDITPSRYRIYEEIFTELTRSAPQDNKSSSLAYKKRRTQQGLHEEP